MSKRGYISRYLLILRKLKAKPYSIYEELFSYMNEQLEYLRVQDDTIDIGFSKRTLQRDIREIRHVFGIDIEFSRAMKGYYIHEDSTENMNFQRMLESFDLFNSLNLAKEFKPFIILENRKAQGTENLFGILHAIKNHLQIKFSYLSFTESKTTIRNIEPYALREFKERWYIIGKDRSDSLVKSFALDRLSNFSITEKSFRIPPDFNIESEYKDCFGIVSPNGETPKEIILSFDPTQGKYIKSLPLHSTQEILVENNKELRIKLKICVTFDFIMELLSYSDSLTVIRPKSLLNQIKKRHEAAFRQYENI